MKPHERHREAAKRRLRVGVAIVASTPVSKGGRSRPTEAKEAAEAEVAKAGHDVVSMGALQGEAEVKSEAHRFLDGNEDVLVLIGGTGMGKDEVTIETIRPMMEKELVGFGELARMLDYRAGGADSILLRATAGVAKGKLLICLPDSPAVVRRTLKAFAPEMPHVVFIARKTA